MRKNASRSTRRGELNGSRSGFQAESFSMGKAQPSSSLTQLVKPLIASITVALAWRGALLERRILIQGRTRSPCPVRALAVKPRIVAMVLFRATVSDRHANATGCKVEDAVALFFRTGRELMAYSEDRDHIFARDPGECIRLSEA
jgi:hypothetical protein